MPSATHRRSKDTKTGPQLHLPEGISEDIEPQFLLLDPQNIRLLERIDTKLHDVPVKLIGQKSIQKELTERFLFPIRYSTLSRFRLRLFTTAF
jgi:hypothetical protein